MKTTIIIDCEDDRELLQHLFVIRKQIKKAFKKVDMDSVPFGKIKLTDSNCYGDHVVTIKDTP